MHGVGRGCGAERAALLDAVSKQSRVVPVGYTSGRVEVLQSRTLTACPLDFPEDCPKPCWTG